MTRESIFLLLASNDIGKTGWPYLFHCGGDVPAADSVSPLTLPSSVMLATSRIWQRDHILA